MIEYVDNNKYDYKVADINLADIGRNSISEAENNNPLIEFRTKLAEQKPLKDVRIVGSASINASNAVFIETLTALGANVRWCAKDNVDTDNNIAAALAQNGVHVYAWQGESWGEYWWCMLKALDFGENSGPNIIIDQSGNISLAIDKGIEAEKHPSLLESNNNDDNEMLYELIEMLFMARCQQDFWYNTTKDIKETVTPQILDVTIINSIIR